jgi:hypothetical protein
MGCEGGWGRRTGWVRKVSRLGELDSELLVIVYCTHSLGRELNMTIRCSRLWSLAFPFLYLTLEDPETMTLYDQNSNIVPLG